MGVIAWIAVGLAAGLLANMLLPGKRSRGLIFTGRVDGLTQAIPATRRWETPGRWDLPEGSP
jgi:uncharacterized membrane protein YeaQ/YmgE (transglycosylase-associated protein family)